MLSDSPSPDLLNADQPKTVRSQARRAVVRGEVKAALAAVEGRPDDAGEMYVAAIESWRTLNCVLDIAVTELELIHLLGPEHPQAVTAKEARDNFTQLGAVPYLERLEAASAT